MQDEIEEIALWPGHAPGSEHLGFEERIVERSTEVGLRDRAVTGVTQPSMQVFRPVRPNGCAVLLIPGGGYQRIVVDKEGYEPAQWLTALGVTAFVLKYRLPGEGHESGQDAPQQDVQRALRLIRARAAKEGIEPWRIGVMGWSAGGHVAARIASGYNRALYEPVDTADDINARPDFCALLYPVISMDEAIAHSGSRQALIGTEPDDASVRAQSCECCVHAETSPTFIALADDDASVSADNSLRYCLALRQAGVSVEMHSFQHGGHGFGLRHQQEPVGAWTALFERWAQANCWL